MWIEMGSDLGFDESECGLRRESRAIGPVGAERIEDVAYLDEAAGVVAGLLFRALPARTGGRRYWNG